jgi:hypothetical protein
LPHSVALRPRASVVRRFSACVGSLPAWARQSSSSAESTATAPARSPRRPGRHHNPSHRPRRMLPPDRPGATQVPRRSRTSSNQPRDSSYVLVIRFLDCSGQGSTKLPSWIFVMEWIKSLPEPLGTAFLQCDNRTTGEQRTTVYRGMCPYGRLLHWCPTTAQRWTRRTR